MSSLTSEEQIVVHELVLNDVATAKRIKNQLNSVTDGELKSVLNSSLNACLQRIEDWNQMLENKIH